MITNTCEFWAYFAPLISETGFAGILATVNGLILISIFPCAKVGSGWFCRQKNSQLIILCSAIFCRLFVFLYFCTPKNKLHN